MVDTKNREVTPITNMTEEEMVAIMKEVERKFALLVKSDDTKMRLFNELIRMSKN